MITGVVCINFLTKMGDSALISNRLSSRPLFYSSYNSRTPDYALSAPRPNL
jgi:hypothetical protein